MFQNQKSGKIVGKVAPSKKETAKPGPASKTGSSKEDGDKEPENGCTKQRRSETAKTENNTSEENASMGTTKLNAFAGKPSYSPSVNQKSGGIHEYARMPDNYVSPDIICQIALEDPSLARTGAEICFKQAGLPFTKILLVKLRTEFEKAMNDLKEDSENLFGNGILLSSSKTRKRAVCLFRFIGELFNLKIISGKILRDCVVKLLNSYNSNSQEKSLERLCALLVTIGERLDSQNPKAIIEIFDQLSNIISTKKISPAIKSAISELMDMRKNGWSRSIRNQVRMGDRERELHKYLQDLNIRSPVDIAQFNCGDLGSHPENPKHYLMDVISDHGPPAMKCLLISEINKFYALPKNSSKRAKYDSAKKKGQEISFFLEDQKQAFGEKLDWSQWNVVFPESGTSTYDHFDIVLIRQIFRYLDDNWDVRMNEARLPVGSKVFDSRFNYSDPFQPVEHLCRLRNWLTHLGSKQIIGNVHTKIAILLDIFTGFKYNTKKITTYENFVMKARCVAMKILALVKLDSEAEKWRNQIEKIPGPKPVLGGLAEFERKLGKLKANFGFQSYTGDELWQMLEEIKLDSGGKDTDKDVEELLKLRMDFKVLQYSCSYETMSAENIGKLPTNDQDGEV